MEGSTLRAATAAAVPSIRDIHHQGIADRVATLNVEPHALDEQVPGFQRMGRAIRWGWPRLATRSSVGPL